MNPPSDHRPTLVSGALDEARAAETQVSRQAMLYNSAAEIPIPSSQVKAIKSPSKAFEITVVVSFLAVVAIAFMLLQSLVRRYSAVTIKPDEDRTDVLHYTRHHWFTADEKLTLQARPSEEDTNRLVWQAKTPKGEWFDVFNFDTQ